MSTDAILVLEDRRYQAMIDADLAALDELCAPELVYTHSSSAQDTKESYLRKLAEGFFDYRWVDHPVDQVLGYDGAALVFGRMVGELTLDGQLRTLNSRTLAVWARQADRWRLVAFQATPIP